MPVGLRFEVPRLRDARDRRGLTLKQLAERSGVALSSLNRLENGRHLAYPSTVQKIAAALNVTVEQLRGLEPMPWDQPRLPGIERPAA